MTAPAGVVRSGPSTVRDLIVARLGVPVAPVFNRTTSQISLTLGTILKQDPTRVAFIISMGGFFDAFVGPTRFFAPQNFSFRIPGLNGVMIATWDEDGEIVAEEWSGQSVGGSSLALITEYLIVPGPGPGHGA